MTLAAQYGFDSALLGNRKHDDRHTVFAGKRESRSVHHLEVLLERLLMTDFVVPLGFRVFLRIGGIDAVDICRLEDGLSLQFCRSQDGSRIGRKEWVSRAGCEQHHTSLA